MPAFGQLPELGRLLLQEADSSVRRRLAMALLILIAGGLLTALAPLALKHLVDALASASSTPAPTPTPFSPGPSTLGLAGLYLLALCGGRLLTELRPLLQGTAEQRLQTRISRRFFGHLLDLPLGFHASHRSGALLHSLSLATAGCQLLMVSALQATPIVIELMTVVVVLVQLGEPRLVLVFVASAAAYAVVFGVGAASLTAYARGVSEAGQSVHAKVADSLLNIETIKCFNAAGHIRGQFADEALRLERRWHGLHVHRVRIGAAVTAVFAVSVTTTLALAAQAVERGSLSIGGFVLASVYMLQMVRPLETLGASVRDISQASEFVRPLLDVLRTQAEPDVQDDEPTTAGAPQLTQQPVRLEFTQAHMAYDGGRAVLQGLDLDIQAGRTLAIVGTSGSGKSSIVRLLLRLYAPQSGEVLWNGRPLGDMALHTLRARIGLVSQDTVLFNDSIAANIAIGRVGATRHEIEEAAGRAQLHDFVAALPHGYDTRVGERGMSLSGGERQRIAVARALLKRPEVYVFDEATSMLDGPTEAAILQNLRKVCAGSTTIIITHRLAAARMADEIAVLDGGRITERGSHKALLALGGRYADMWRAQRGASTPTTAGGLPAVNGRQACARNRAWHRRRA